MSVENGRQGCATGFEKVLLITLIVLVGIVGVFLVFAWRSNQQAAAPARDSQIAQGAQSGEKGGALEAYHLAKSNVREWADDALLLRASGTWPNQVFSPQLENWAFVFYSPARDETASISVVGSSTGPISTRSAQKPLAPASDEAWAVDSTTIVEAFLEGAGGNLFIEKHEDVSMALTLNNDERIVWVARLVDWSSGNVLSRQFDARTGQLVGSP